VAPIDQEERIDRSFRYHGSVMSMGSEPEGYQMHLAKPIEHSELMAGTASLVDLSYRLQGHGGH
jgi:hypothetical protein